MTKKTQQYAFIKMGTIEVMEKHENRANNSIIF